MKPSTCLEWTFDCGAIRHKYLLSNGLAENKKSARIGIGALERGKLKEN